MDKVLKKINIDTGFVCQALSSCSDNYIYVWDIKSDIVLISKNMVEDFCLESELIQGFKDKWLQSVHERDYGRICKLQEQLLEGKVDSINIEYQFIKDVENEEYVWLRNRSTVRRDAKTNEPITVVGVLHNMDLDDDIDPVTGLLTHDKCRKYYLDMQKEQHDNAKGAILLIGIDEFGTINTLNNHAFGDAVLRTTVKAFLEIIPEKGHLFRFDGDQFAILIEDSTKEEIHEIFRQIQWYTNSPHTYNDITYRFTVSGGMIGFPEDGNEWMEIEKGLSIALKKAKILGKNRCIEFNKEMLSEEIWEQELNHLMANSIENNFEGFIALYQPVCMTDTLVVKGAEALLRFSTPNGKLISPIEFIPILESTQMIIPVGKWVLEQAVKTCKEWIAYNPEFVMNVNVSYIQLRDSTFCDFVEKLLEKYQLDTKHIVLELTESYFISDATYIKQTLARLHDLHLMIAMDDFGTGYSSLARLSQFNVDVIKIDRAFVQSLHEKKYNDDFIDAVVRLCHNIGMKVCVEGVETVEEQKSICALNADYVQGFYVSRPIDKGVFFRTFISQPNINDPLVVRPDQQLRYRQIFGDKDVLTALMNATPLASNFWNREHEIVSCNEETLHLFGINDVDTFRQDFLSFSPLVQPDGQSSEDKARQLIDQAFDGEHISVLWVHLDVKGNSIPCEVIFTRISFLNDYLVVSYTRDMRKQVEMEQTISTFNNRLKGLLDATPLCLNLWNRNFENVMCNQEAVKLFNLHDEKEYMDRFFELSPEYQPDGNRSDDKAMEMITYAFENERIQFFWMHQNVQGEEIPCEITLVKIEGIDNDGKPMIAGYTRDIRDELESKRKIDTFNTRLKALLDATPLCLNLWNRNFENVMCNQAAVKLFDLNNESEYMESFFKLSPEYQPDGTKSTEKAMRQINYAFENKQVHFFWMHQNLQGVEIPCEITLVKIEGMDSDGEAMIAGYTRDITKEREAAKAERMASQRITAVLNSMPLASILWNLDQTVIDSNEVAVKLFKAKNKEDLNTRFYDLFPEKQPDGSISMEKCTIKFKEAIDGKKCVFEWMYRSLDGEEIPCEVSIVRLNLEGEDIMVAYSRDLRELRQTLELNSRLTEIAYVDMLTGTATRARFMEKLEIKFEEGKEFERFALIVFDIDYFKSINDTFGHEAGDEALKTVTHKISKLLPKGALLGRFGGDEFMVQIDDINKEDLHSLMKHLTKEISETKLYHDGHSFRTSISIGAAYKLSSDKDYNSLLKRADKAMYKAKNRGRNGFIIL